MFLTQNELHEVRQELYREMAAVERLAQNAGSYNYVCAVAGDLILSHRPVGYVLKDITGRSVA